MLADVKTLDLALLVCVNTIPKEEIVIAVSPFIRTDLGLEGLSQTHTSVSVVIVTVILESATWTKRSMSSRVMSVEVFAITAEITQRESTAKSARTHFTATLLWRLQTPAHAFLVTVIPVGPRVEPWAVCKTHEMEKNQGNVDVRRTLKLELAQSVKMDTSTLMVLTQMDAQIATAIQLEPGMDPVCVTNPLANAHAKPMSSC
jgi:hypothetical protein